MKEISLKKRLQCATHFVRDASCVADIGTDHAYLPIYLVSTGKSKFAIASDINEGPIKIAKKNILSYDLEDKIATQVSNGLDGIEKYNPTDIVICGMGGELIAEIIEKSAYVKNSDIRLVLQPMTSVKELRKYLNNGFLIIDESIVCEDGKIYQIICASYDGKVHNYTDIELELGRENIKKGGEEFDNLLNSTIAKNKKRSNGMKKGGHDTSEIDEFIIRLEELKK